MSPDNPPSFRQQDLFGGQGNVDIWNLLTMKSPPFSAVLWCSLEPNGYVGKHRQQDDPEIVICLSGEGEATIGKQQHSLRRGKMVYLPFGQVLSIRNHSDSTSLDYLIIKAKNT